MQTSMAPHLETPPPLETQVADRRVIKLNWWDSTSGKKAWPQDGMAVEASLPKINSIPKPTGDAPQCKDAGLGYVLSVGMH